MLSARTMQPSRVRAPPSIGSPPRSRTLRHPSHASVVTVHSSARAAASAAGYSPRLRTRVDRENRKNTLNEGLSYFSRGAPPRSFGLLGPQRCRRAPFVLRETGRTTTSCEFDGTGRYVFRPIEAG